MTERAFGVVGGLVLAILCLFAVAVIADWIRTLHGDRRVRRRKELFVDQHRAERQREVARLQKTGPTGISEASKRAHLQAVTKAGDSRS